MPEKINLDVVAQLSRLRLKPEEREKLSKELEKIVEYVDELKGLETGNAPAESHPHQKENVFREDVVIPSNIREAVLMHAPKREENFFKVPKIIEGS